LTACVNALLKTFSLDLPLLTLPINKVNLKQKVRTFCIYVLDIANTDFVYGTLIYTSQAVIQARRNIN